MRAEASPNTRAALCGKPTLSDAFRSIDFAIMEQNLSETVVWKLASFGAFALEILRKKYAPEAFMRGPLYPVGHPGRCSDDDIIDAARALGLAQEPPGAR